MSLTVNEVSAQRFLEALAPGERVFVFQTFDDNADRKERTLSRVIVGSLAESLPQLNALQAQGAGVFVQMQGGTGRGQEFITHGRTVIVDADEPDDTVNVVSQIKQEMPVPSAVIQSSPGKIHVYWFTDAVDAGFVSELTADAADIAGTDPSVRTPERVMRLPGSWHMKDPTAPYQVTPIQINAERRYNADQLRVVFASCHRRGARTKSGQYTGVTRYDPVFGLPITEADDLSVLPSGDRTQRLISLIGRMVADGYSAEYIEADLRRIAAEGLPAGQADQ